MREKKGIWSLGQRIKTVLFYILLFLFPTQLALHFWPSFSFVFGIRVDYLSVAIYLTDILIFLLILLDLPKVVSMISKKEWSVGLFLVLASVNIIFSSVPVLSLIKWIHISILFLFAIYISANRWRFGEEAIEKVIYFSLVFFSLIGIVQFFLGHTLGGVFYYLGERSFNISTPGIALFSFFGREILRAYSTFSHPNSFAGFLGAAGIFLILSKSFKKLPLRFFGLAIIFFATLITFSLSTFVSLIFVGVLYLFEKRVKLKEKYYLWFLVILFSVSTVQFFVPAEFITSPAFSWDKVDQRLELAYVSGKMVSERFLTGEGLNTFISNLPRFKTPSGYIWFLQPVHNIYLLVFSEVGVFGLVLFFFFVSKGILKLFKEENRQVLYTLLFILITGLFDHYWLTLQQNLVLMFFIFSYFI